MLTAKRLISSIAIFSLAIALHGSAQEKVDLETISKIRYEGFRNFQGHGDRQWTHGPDWPPPYRVTEHAAGQ